MLAAGYEKEDEWSKKKNKYFSHATAIPLPAQWAVEMGLTTKTKACYLQSGVEFFSHSASSWSRFCKPTAQRKEANQDHKAAETLFKKQMRPVVGGAPSCFNRGLKNSSSYCYFNAVMQCLAPCFAGMSLAQQCKTKDRPFYTAMKDLVQGFEQGNPRAHLDGTAAFGPLLERFAKAGTQQDASEFFLYVLSGMHEERHWPLKQEDVLRKAGSGAVFSGTMEESPITRIFGGFSSSTISHAQGSGRQESVTVEPFTMLALEPADSVQEGLRSLCAIESLKTATKQIGFIQLPKATKRVLNPIPQAQTAPSRVVDFSSPHSGLQNPMDGFWNSAKGV